MGLLLLLRADSEDVTVSINDNDNRLVSKNWQAGRELSNQLLSTIDELLKSEAKALEDLAGIVVYQGPGSYTGLRISISVANALGYSLEIPVIGMSGDNWRLGGIKELGRIRAFRPVAPAYGGEVYTTKPKK